MFQEVHFMNELEFKRHLKDLAHGHHHPEEHDWETTPAAAKKTSAGKTARPKRTAAKKTARRR
jgi:hypothetical protein